MYIHSNMKIVSILFILIFVLSACVGPQPKSIKQEILFRITWDLNSSRGDALFNIMDHYNEQTEAYHVTLIGGDENRNNILEDLSNNKVDVFMMPYRFIQDKEIADKLLPINQYFEASTIDYYDSIIKLASNNNELKGLPWIGHSMCLIFNVALCNEAGINPYEWTSLSDLSTGLETLTLNTDAKGIGLVGAEHHDITWMVNQFIYTYGGSLIETDTHGDFVRISINSQPTIDAIHYYKDILGSYAQPGWQDQNGSDVIESFANSEIGFEIQGPWAITDLWKRGSPFDIGVISLSQLGVYSEVGPIMLSVSSETLNTQGSIDFLNFLNSNEGLDLILEGEYDPKHDAYYPFRIPIKKSSSQSDFYKQFPEFKVFSEGFKLPSINTPSTEWANKSDLYAEILHKIMIEDISIEEGLMEVTK